MTTREKSLRPVTRSPRRKTEGDGWNDVKDFDVYKCADGFNPFTSTSGAKEELLGRMPYSDNFLKDAAQRFGGGRYLYFIPIDGNGNWGSGKPMYVPKVIDAPDDDGDLRVKIAKLEAQLENAKRNGSHSQIADLMAGLRELDTMRAQAGSQKTPLEYLREIKEANELLNPRRENPAPQQGSDSDLKIFEMAIALLKSDDPSVRESANPLIDTLMAKATKNELSWVEFGMQALQNPTTVQIVQTAGSVLLGVFDRIFPPRPAPVQAPQPQAQAPQQQQQPYAPNGYHAQQPQQAPQQQQPPAQPSPETAQQQATQQQAQQPVDPYTEMLGRLIPQLANNGPVDEGVKTINGFLLMYPQYAEVVDNQFGMEAATLLGAIGTIPGCEAIPQLPHAKSWIESFQAKFFDETTDNEFDHLIELNGEGVKS